MGRFSEAKIDWAPFSICLPNEKPPYPRSLSTAEGLGDRLRFVAFAEKQAKEAFELASKIYSVPEQVQKIWLELSREEAKHLSWLLARMQALGVQSDSRPQSLSLWHSFDRCETPHQFAKFMASAEDRGKIAGIQFHQTLISIDPITAELFQKIAEEEEAHIELAAQITPFL